MKQTGGVLILIKKIKVENFKVFDSLVLEFESGVYLFHINW